MSETVYLGRGVGSTRRLLKHGLIWLASAFLLDNTTSWIMMSLRGPLSEGTEVQRLLYEERSMGALVQWLVANREWFAFFALGLTAYAATAIQVERRRKPTWVAITISLNTLFFTGILVTWLPAFYRFYGAGSNLFGILLEYSTNGASAAWLLFTLGMIAIELFDLFRLWRL